MKSIITSILLSLSILFSAQAQKDPAARKVLDAMSAKYQKIPSFVADFSYTMQNDDEDIDEGFEGNILVKKDKYQLKMEGQEITFDGTDIYTYLADDEEITISAYDPEGEDISISNIFDIYKEGFKYVYSESTANGTIDVVDLVPEDREKDYFKIRMNITASGRDLKSFMVFDKSGSRYLYTIKSFKEDASITDDTFKFDAAKYPGVEVVDFR